MRPRQHRAALTSKDRSSNLRFSLIQLCVPNDSFYLIFRDPGSNEWDTENQQSIWPGSHGSRSRSAYRRTRLRRYKPFSSRPRGLPYARSIYPVTRSNEGNWSTCSKSHSSIWVVGRDEFWFLDFVDERWTPSEGCRIEFETVVCCKPDWKCNSTCPYDSVRPFVSYANANYILHAHNLTLSFYS